MERIVYLDNAATTKPIKSAVTAMQKNMEENYFNPSALYSGGLSAERELAAAKNTVAESLGVAAKNIIFTSGGTESNNTCIFSAAQKLARFGKHIVVGCTEHPSVLEAVKKLEKQGFAVSYLPAGIDGYKTDELKLLVKPDTVLVSLMLVNNETGFISDLSKVKEIIKSAGSHALFHSDCVQAYKKVPINIKDFDLISISAHKIGGPKGIGAIYAEKPENIEPYILGGGQQGGMRSGTEPVFLASGFAAAVQGFNAQNINEINGYARKVLNKYKINSPCAPSLYSPFILNISVKGYKSETLLHFLESRGIYVSSGSACSKGKKSHVLTALGIQNSDIDSALRISFCGETQKEDIDLLANALDEAEKTLIKKRN